MKRPGASGVAVLLFVVGAATLLVGEATWLRLAGSIALAGYVVAALFAIATPDFLGSDRQSAGPRGEAQPPGAIR